MMERMPKRMKIWQGCGESGVCVNRSQLVVRAGQLGRAVTYKAPYAECKPSRSNKDGELIGHRPDGGREQTGAGDGAGEDKDRVG